MCRWKARDAGFVRGSVAVFAASSSQPVRVRTARQLSSHLQTTAPSASCDRNFAGTASRPLSSTECRYSPVNTCLGYPCPWVMRAVVVLIDQAVRGRLVRSAVGAGLAVIDLVGSFPTSHHLAPLGRAFYTARGARQSR